MRGIGRIAVVVSVVVVSAVGCQSGGCQSSSGDVTSAEEGSETSGTSDVEMAASEQDTGGGESETASGDGEIEVPTPLQEAPEPSDRLEATPEAEALTGKIESHFENNPGRRMYIQVDKPLYRPGETIWAKSWNLVARDLTGIEDNRGIVYKLLDPKGNEVKKKRVREKAGHAHVDFQLGDEVRGGRYTIRAETMDGHEAERTVIVSDFEEPRVKKDLEFVRKAYGAGDEVVATLKLRRGTDEPLASHPVEGRVRLDGEQVTEVSATTDEEGGTAIRFELPDEIERGDGILTVRVDDGGVTESISRRIPIVLDSLNIDFYPEGGSLVEGLESRVYFSADKPDGKPADVTGHIEDDRGEVVAEFRSFKNGMGRFSFTPDEGTSYEAVIDRPVGVDERFEVPAAQKDGCVLEHFDDLRGERAATRLAVRCTESQEVIVSGMMRDNVLDAARVTVPDDESAVVYLEPDNEALANWQGVARVTVFSGALEPLAERLVYRRRDKRLDIEVDPTGGEYGPRDRVELEVTTRGPEGAPQPARVAMSVVDDKVVSFADDESPHLLTSLLLEPELPGDIEKPNFYFDREEKASPYALDLLMGTRGYRSFEWKRVLSDGEVIRGSGESAGESEAADEPQVIGELDHPKGEKENQREPARAEVAADREEPAAQNQARRAAEPAADEGANLIDPLGGGGGGAAGRAPPKKEKPAWAKVRSFPVPDYSGDHGGPRDDFRDTVYWNPDLETGNDGQATVDFSLSDAVTSFRVFTEGVGRGFAGRDETVFESSLPFSLQAKLPLEVSAGDRIEVPVTVMNERDRPADVELTTSFGELLEPTDGDSLPDTMSLDAEDRDSRYLTLDVTGERGESTVRLSATSGGLTDAIERTISVAPRGFPREAAHSGQLTDEVEHIVDVSDAREGSVVASVQVYPSPVSTMTESLDGILREPHGCFEQASSANYPNVMLLRYLETQGGTAPEVVSRAKSMMEDGYRKLTSYETDEKGYEWFGKAPGHEALTAYGLLQFTQMREVFGSVDRAMIERTADWLLNRRDAEGGFVLDDKAVDSFGRASQEVTDAYITYSLTEAGWIDELGREIRNQSDHMKTTDDAYILALAVNTLLNAERGAVVRRGIERLVEMQNTEGSWTNADHSITRSRGRNLHIETTALATLALMEAGGHRDAVRKGIEWLNEQRDAFGKWGATQATILTLQALTRYIEVRKEQLGPGSVRVSVGGETVGEKSYTTDRTEPLRFEIGDELTLGENDLRLERTEGNGEVPYTISVQYRTEKPATRSEAAVELETDLLRENLEMGETVRLTATIENNSDDGLGMTLARIALPGGLTHQQWQLEELREEGTVDAYETEGREVILYFRQMKPGGSRKVPLELTTTVPGEYRGQASRAYPYYDDTYKYWVEPIEVTVER